MPFTTPESPPVDDSFFTETPEHPSVLELLAYFEGKRGDREMADRADISPSDLVRFMPNLVIVEVIDNEGNFRTRLFGTALVELFGEERTGKVVSEFAEKSALPTNRNLVQSRWIDVARRTLEKRGPVFTKSALISTNRLYLIGHGISVPLTAGGTEPAQIMGAMFVTRAKEADAG